MHVSQDVKHGQIVDDFGLAFSDSPRALDRHERK